MEKKCKQCKKRFARGNKLSDSQWSSKRFCSHKCSGSAKKNGEERKCPRCGKNFYRARYYIRLGKGKYCSHNCAIHRFLDRSTGYIRCYSPSTQKARTEHRVVMEKVLGRLLRRNEHVHHINGNKVDNRVSNLLVLSASKHATLHGRHRHKKSLNDGMKN